MYYPNMNMNPYQGMKPSTNAINWVQGIEGAKAFTLAPKENVILMDSEVNDKFYIKICDDIGRCTLRVFKYQEELEEKPAPADLSEYVKKSELQSLLNEMLGGSANEPAISGTQSAKPVSGTTAK